MSIRTLHGEWTKLRTLPGTAWSALAMIAFTVATSVAVAAATDTANCPPGQCGTDPTVASLSGVYIGQNVVVIFAALAATGEYATRMIHTTLTASPHRIRLLAAKALVVTALTLAAGLPASLGSTLAGQNILPGNGFTTTAGYPPMSMAEEPILRATLGTVAYLGLLALLSVGVGVLVRDSAIAITTVLALLYLPPIVTSVVTDAALREDIQRVSPMSAGLAIQATRDLTHLPIGPWAGLGVLAAYTGIALALAAAVLALRDA
jgi:ABC-2 type transport system permease protein